MANKKHCLKRSIGNRSLVLFCALALVFFFSAGALAQEAEEPTTTTKLSLADCIASALKNREIIQAKLANIEVRRAMLTRARLSRFAPKFDMKVLFGPIPDVANGFGPRPNNFPDYSIDWSEWNIFARISVEVFQPIYTFEKLGGIIEAAQLGVKDAELEKAAQEMEIALRVAKSYWALSLAQTLHKFLDDNAGRLDKALKKVDELMAEGSTEVTEIDKFKIKLYQSNLKKRRVQSQAGIDALKFVLGFLIVHDNPQQIEIVDEKLGRPREKPSLTMAQALQAALTERPEVKRINNLVSIRRALLKVARGSYFPNFFLAGFFNYAVAPGREDIHNPYLNDDFNTINGGAALGLQQDLSFHIDHAKLGEARSELQQSIHQQGEVKRAIALDAETTHLELERYWNELEHQRQTFRYARSWIAAATLNFNLGILPTKDLLDAFVAYSESLVNYYKKIFEFRTGQAKLKKVMNQPLVGETET